MPVWTNVPRNTKVGQKIDDRWVAELKEAPSFTKKVQRANVLAHNEFWKDRDPSRVLEVPEVGPDLLWARVVGPQLQLLD
jgi:hypothetical protein